MINEFLKHIIIINNCWEWTGYINNGKNQGYAKFYYNSNEFSAHRWIYQYYYNEDIKDGLVIDHICRNRKCVNPIHLREITHKENILSRIGIAAINAKKTHCKYGHQLSGGNIGNNTKGGRSCKTCNYVYQRNKQAQLLLNSCPTNLSPRLFKTRFIFNGNTR